MSIYLKIVWGSKEGKEGGKKWPTGGKNVKFDGKRVKKEDFKKPKKIWSFARETICQFPGVALVTYTESVRDKTIQRTIILSKN